jgi:hypothetical protein
MTDLRATINEHSIEKVETFSAQAMINEKLHSTETLLKLEQLMNEVFIRRAERIPLIPSVTFGCDFCDRCSIILGLLLFECPHELL